MKVNHLYYKTKSEKKMHAAEVGHGEKLVFLIHGWSNNWESWQELIAADSDDEFTFIAIDLLGFGDSDRLDSYSISDLACFVTEFVDWYLLNNPAKKSSVYVGGMSLGSLVSAEIALNHPQVVTGYVLLGPVFRCRKIMPPLYILEKFMLLCRRIRIFRLTFAYLIKARLISYVLALFNSKNFDRNKVKKYGIRGKNLADSKAFVDLAIDIARYDLARRIDKLGNDIKMLLIVGENDRYLNVSHLREGRYIDFQKCNNVNLKIVKNSGHTISYEKPTESMLFLKQFVR